MDNLSYQLDHIKRSFGISEDDFIGIFLYGSQNYKLDYEDSDVDSILIVRSADKQKQELQIPSGKVKVYTLRHFIYLLKQGDLECYEILYTKYKILNSLYEGYWTNFVQDFSNHMSYERIKRSLCNKLDEHLHHVLWIMINKDNARYDKKRLYWAVRVCNQLSRLNNGEDFESSLIYMELIGYDLMKIKTITNYLTSKELSEIYKHLVEFIRSQPLYSKEVLNEEERCLSKLYADVVDANGIK